MNYKSHLQMLVGKASTGANVHEVKGIFNLLCATCRQSISGKDPARAEALFQTYVVKMADIGIPVNVRLLKEHYSK